MKKSAITLGIVFSPILAFAQLPPAPAPAQGNGDHLFSLFDIVLRSLNIIIGILITLALVYFIWACVKFFVSADAEEKAENKQHIIFGLIGIFAIVSVWGLVGFLGNLLGVGQGGTNQPIPCVISNNNGVGGCN